MREPDAERRDRKGAGEQGRWGDGEMGSRGDGENYKWQMTTNTVLL
ncbi:hypothetical protein I8748_14190 [Nostoc sp. CENA67]|uniref:Uncharacterized protein n=1 Tax=Amazonocrinis nigriterrae CENA67 TaxID=2794033 RepID=A0A8J7HP69_9NOST|nr:hypothetical protein [Amazonocrinis nigriterrae]MBH8563321.1 hypothetical protein [Amazonocrinis nigriterrae CENA67]